MNKFRFCIILFILLFSQDPLFSQTKISGRITDQVDSSSVPYVSVILYQYQSNKILDYTQTDIDGFYSLEIPSEPIVLTLKTSHLAYHRYQQDIVIGSDKQEKIALFFSLKPKVEELIEVIITGPIIVKEDTIIYDVEHFTEARNQTLEEVLAKIPGFKIQGDGEIKVNGKVINKVLIDGEEVANSGAAMLTRSIAPEDVKSVEVRFDEKNDKLKESLLDSREFVVLDIKLKDGLNKSFFGKVRVTLGYQNNTEPGGYLNTFSLKKKLKIHLFAEYDRFGEQTISLDKIKNIGAEAFQKIFQIPADFQALTEREEFSDEIYGFKNYTLAEKGIIGLSIRHSISDHLDVYFGSYNAYAKNGKAQDYSQKFTESSTTNQLIGSQKVTDYSSKNKLEIRLDKGKVKARLDGNIVLFRNKVKTVNNESIQNFNYLYGDVHDSKSFYENFFFEYAPTNQLGIQFKASHSIINSDHSKDLGHNDVSYASVFVDENSNPVFDFHQNMESTATNFLTEIMVQYRSKVGALNAGFGFQDRTLDARKEGSDTESSSLVTLFTGTATRLDFQKWGPFLKHRLGLGAFTLNNEVRFSSYSYPDPANDQKVNQLLEFKSGLEVSSGFDYIFATLSRRLSSFPMQKLVEGYDLRGFQNISMPNPHALNPTPEYTLEITGAKKFDEINLLFDPSLLYGRIQNSNRFLFSSEPLIAVAYDQLESEYLLLTFPLNKSFKTIPLAMILEPEWLINQNQNVDPSGNFYQTRTTRSLFGIKFNTLLDDKPFDFFLYPKYSVFLFQNELFDSRQQQEILSLDLKVELDFFDEKLLVTPAMRTVSFLENTEAEFTNISLKIESPATKIYWFIIMDNMLNNTNFNIQAVYPTYFVTANNSVFERYVKFGFEYKFK